MGETTPHKRVLQHFRQLQNDRRTWEPYWREVSEYIAPQRGRGLPSSNANEVNRGDRPDLKRINGTASRALSILASGMQSGLTSKARQWFLLTHPDPALGRYQPVREWYDKVQEILEGIFRKSNLYAALLHTYFEMAGFGQGALAVFSHPDKVLYCRPYTVGTYYLSSDEWNEIDTFFHAEWLSARQLVQLYGRSALPDYVLNAYDNGKYEDRFEVVNGLLRHPEAYGLKLGEQFSVASVHFLANASDRDG